jgi:hypothetical protein
MQSIDHVVMATCESRIKHALPGPFTRLADESRASPPPINVRLDMAVDSVAILLGLDWLVIIDLSFFLQGSSLLAS